MDLSVQTAPDMSHTNDLERVFATYTDMDKEKALWELLSPQLPPYSLESFLSHLSPESPIPIWIHQNPVTPQRYSRTIPAALLERLSLFLFSLNSTPRELGADVHYARSAPAVLHILSTLRLPEAELLRELTPPPSPLLEEWSSEELSPVSADAANSSDDKFFSGMNQLSAGRRSRGRARGRGQESMRPPPVFVAHIEVKSGQGNTKRNRRKGPLEPALDTKPFQALCVSVPQTRQDAERLESQIIGRLRTILRSYLKTLRSPQVVEAIQARSAPAEAPQAAATVTESPPDIDPALENAPAAFPMVQPMKAALFFESAAGFGEWRILISTRASRDLREARRTDAKMFKIYIKKIKELSNGHFSDDNQKRLTHNISDAVPIYEAKMTGDTRLVYQVDCQPEYGDNDQYRQVLRVFGIYTHAQLDGRFWDSMGHQLARNGTEYRRRCNFRERPKNAGDKVFAPKIFNKPDEVLVGEDFSFMELPKAHLEEIHSLLVLEKFVTFSQALLNSLLADEDIAHVFAVSPKEKEIIEHKVSCYVLGRSGTGKTTTMLFKMLGLQRAYELGSHPGLPKPRQIFVTQSRVLAGKVEEYFKKLMESLASGAKDIKELAQLAKAKKDKEQNTELVDMDDEEGWKSDLPTSFSLLEEKHFPLFITFDRLCLLLEADLRKSNVNTKALVIKQHSEEDEPESPIQGLNRAGQLVSFEAFETTYWPHFPQVLTKGLDPSLVFSEFMGIIKGSEEALGKPGHFLDGSTYENLSHRGKSTFANQRKTVYSVFQAYVRLKRDRGDWDSADRTHNILETLQDTGVPGQKIDYLYVDEAQDNLLIDALLLRSISSNPDGLFWAGDTAQTISVGSSFRFDDLKSFLFRVEKARHERGLSLDNRVSEPPKTFQLCANYRSHGGIVQCAHSVIELITKMWPHAIDSLQPEKGIVEGLKPVFFSGFNKDTVRYESFLFGESGTHIEFGAQQCILVRNQEARKKLREEVGDIGLIMTLYESKGLEFNDVLLYNFFEDSTVDLGKWRVVLNGLTDVQRPMAPAPRFDESRHAAVCSELKFLYVAVTRARKNLWILDSSERSEPMRELWSLSSMIDEHTPGSELPQLAVVSSKEEWEKSGRALFGHKRFLQAMHCFQRAEMPKEVNVANAHFLRDQARGTPVGSRMDGTKRALAFIEAGKAFVKCGEEATKEMRSYFKIAGDCFILAEDPRRAAKAYLDAAEYTKSAENYRKCGMFDEAVAVLKDHKSKIVSKTVESITQHARLFYFKAGKLKQANDLFDSHEDALEYMEDYDLDVARASLLEAMDKFTEAGELHLAEGRTMEAIRLFLKAQNDMEALTRAKDVVLEGLWSIMPFGVSFTVAKQHPNVEQLLKMALKLNTSLLQATDRDEVEMFHAISVSDTTKLLSLARNFTVANAVSSALLCLDHIFVNPPHIAAAPAGDVAKSLGIFLSYSQLLSGAAHDKNPCANIHIAKAFAFKRASEATMYVPPATFFHQVLSNRRAYEVTPEGGFVIADHELARIFRRELCSRLEGRSKQLETICRAAPAFNLCLNHLFAGQCNRSPCAREHIDPIGLTADWYNHRVRIHLQVVLILSKALGTGQGHDDQARQRHWIGRLYDTLAPPTYLMGSLANLQTRSIPEFLPGWRTAAEWCRRSLNCLDPYKPGFLTTVLQNLTLLDDKLGYALRAPCIVSYRPPFLMRPGPKEAFYVIHDLLDSADCGKPWHLLNGVAFFLHVVDNKLAIDINALCTFLDKLCALLVLTLQFRPASAWHGICLPRSWCLMFCSKFQQKQDTVRHIGFVRNLMKSISPLLEQLYSGQDGDHLTYGRQPIPSASIRHLYIARICRAVCLVGYNINDPVLRGMILSQVTSLRKPNRRFPTSLNGYVSAKEWNHLARTVRQSTGRSELDELVCLQHISKTSGTQPHRGSVRTVVHSSKDIDAGTLDPRASSLNAAAAPFVPRPAPTPEEEEEEENEPEEMHGEGEVTQGPSVDPEELARSIAQTREQEASAAAASQKEIQATKVLQTIYRKERNRRGIERREGIAMHLFRQFSDCQEAAQSMEWPHVHYRQLFLGPLPHILVCLAVAKDHCDKLKKKAKERFTKAKDAELEEVGERISKVNEHQRAVQKLQKVLGPKSSLHKTRDLVELKSRCEEVRILLEELPKGCSPDPHEDLALGLKGIVQPRKVKKRKLKPRRPLESDLEDSEEWESEWEEVDEEAEKAAALEGSDSTGASHSPSHVRGPPTREEIRAARVLQLLYQKQKDRRASRKTEAVYPQFESCLQHSQGLRWPHSHHRQLFLGPLPHILACLDAAAKHYEAMIVQTKKLWRQTETVEKGERLSVRLNRLTSTKEDVQRMRKVLSPQSPIHHTQDATVLRAVCVEALEALGDREGLPVTIHENLKLGMKAFN